MLSGRLLALTAVVALAASSAGCPGEPPPPPPARPAPRAAPPPPPEPRDDGRLTPLATPVQYRLDLKIDPTQPRFSGEVAIDVDVAKPTNHIVLHAHAIDVARARALVGPPPEVPPQAGRQPEGPRNARRELAAQPSMRMAKGGKVPEELVLTFDDALPAGRATLELSYAAPFDDELSGLYRLKDGDRWYAFTQFEATDARRAFPCFDEPTFKVPFYVSITTPPGMIAVSNSPETSREGSRFRFAPTPPLPSYLVAFAVGDFDVIDAGRAEKPPIRLVTTKGKPEGFGTLALESTAGLLSALEQYFGIPYPYAKLDIVAVPEFSAGAMENPGLVTFREERLLLDPQRSSVYMRRAQALTIAHELAHQWFGDLVTASWWNDLWLNEGMATWIEWRVVDRWRPSYGVRDDAVASGLAVMDLDALASARAVRQPVTSTGEANEAFDGITYEKGAAVLATIEKWLGEDVFRRGVQTYLKDNAWKSVQADRLLGALDAASGKDVTQMASGFLDKPGVPVVDAHLECERGGRWHAELTQSAWRPLGSKTPEQDDRVWTIPVCTRALGEKKDTCADLAFGAPSLVAGRGRCPPAVHPNVEAGYYRFTVTDKEMLRLAESKKELDVAARLSLLANAWAGVRAGAIEPRTMVKMLPSFDDDGARQVTGQIVRILYGMDRLVEEDVRPAFQSLVIARLGKRKKALGWLPKPNESGTGDEALLRRHVLVAMGDLAEDEATLKEADDLARKWLADPASIDADTAAVAVDLGSRRADASRLDALREAAKKAKTREDRIVALHALVGFDNPKLVEKALDLVLTDEIRVPEMRYVMGAAFDRRGTQRVAEAWVRTHWTELRKKLPGGLSAGLLRGASVGCSQEDAAERAEFYGPQAATIEGAERGLAEALETVSLCAALRQHWSTALRAALLNEKKK